jgi:hypothetical protein
MNALFLPAAASGACKISFAATTVSSRRGSATRAVMYPTPPIAITAPMPKRSKSPLTLRRSVTGSCWNSFFQIHDPTTRNRQGNDVGASYRSAIFYTSNEQKRIAEDTIADVDASGLWPGKVVTEVKPAGAFWEAEPEHQDYLEQYPNGYTCHFVRPGWKLPPRESAAAE